MKRVFVLAFLPMVLFGLETVNLIKDAGFEMDDDSWIQVYSKNENYGDTYGDSTIIILNDPDDAFSGHYSGSINNLIRPSPGLPGDYYTVGNFYQYFEHTKELEDLDSVEVFHRAILPDEPENNRKAYSGHYGLQLWFFGPPDETIYRCYYHWIGPLISLAEDDAVTKSYRDTMPDEGYWCKATIDLNELSAIKGFPPTISFDSLRLFGSGLNGAGPWLSQKVFFDDIRLMGYADYDVGVKEILPGDSLEVGTPYQPVARIKNFGRENADTFLVIAEIWDGSSLIYVDTLPWSLDGDTEDTVTFADFDPPFTGPYTLTVRTFMEPDECDEDDEVSKEIGHTAIAENSPPNGLTLEVMCTSRGALKVSFETPNGKVGNLSVYDATGRRIERMAVTQSGSVEFGDLPSGAYFIKLECSSASVAEKAVVLQ